MTFPTRCCSDTPEQVTGARADISAHVPEAREVRDVDIKNDV